MKSEVQFFKHGSIKFRNNSKHSIFKVLYNKKWDNITMKQNEAPKLQSEISVSGVASRAVKAKMKNHIIHCGEQNPIRSGVLQVNINGKLNKRIG